MTQFSGAFRLHSDVQDCFDLSVLGSNSPDNQSCATPETAHITSCSAVSADHILNLSDHTLAFSGQPRWTSEKGVPQTITTEVLPQLIEAFASSGDAILNRITGHFALLLVNNVSRECLLASDRIGNYRIYWHLTGNGEIAFSTSLGKLLRMCRLQPEISNQALYCYMYFHMVPTPLSIYENIQKLPPASCLAINSGELSEYCYWKPEFSATSKYSVDELSTQLHAFLNSSVARSINGKEKYGAFLSGGLDSSTIAGVLSRVDKAPANTFSIGFNAKEYDETPYARISAEHFGTTQHEYYVTPEDVLESLNTIVSSFDEPFGNSSVVPTYHCAKFAREIGITTLLAGDGGDELFAGNKRYGTQHYYRYYTALPKVLRESIVAPIIRCLPSQLRYIQKAQNYLLQADIPMPERLQIYNFLYRQAGEEIFTAEFLGSVDTSVPLELLNDRYHSIDTSELNRMLYLDWQTTLADNDLRKVNLMCNLAGVDVEYPLLSDEIINFSLGIPDSLKLKGTRLRYFFKKAVDGFLSPQTLTKSKHGFGLPFGIWLNEFEPLKALAHTSLQDLKTRGIFRPEFIDQTLRMHEQQHASYYGELIWILMVLELWLKAER